MHMALGRLGGSGSGGRRERLLVFNVAAASLLTKTHSLW